MELNQIITQMQYFIFLKQFCIHTTVCLFSLALFGINVIAKTKIEGVGNHTNRCHSDLLDRINSYLNNITSLRASFEQYDPASSDIQKGTIILKKPDQMRLEYTSPKHVLILAQKKDILHYDYELEEKSFVSVDQMITELLRHNQIKTQLKSCELLGENQAMVLLKTSGKNNNNQQQNDLSNTDIALVFQTEPVMLKEIRRLENGIIEAEMKLNSLKYDDANADDFQFRDAKLYRLSDK